MKKLLIAAIAASSMIAMAMPSEAAKKSCKRLGGEGTAVTNELATANATMALSDQATAGGMTLKGKAAVKCKYEGIVSTCTAKQTACK